jgi:hypothetical protein
LNEETKKLVYACEALMFRLSHFEGGLYDEVHVEFGKDMVDAHCVEAANEAISIATGESYEFHKDRFLKKMKEERR